MSRFRVLAAILLLALLTSSTARADDAAWSALREDTAVLIVRHAQTEPGVGDPPGFRLGDCATQRNLSPAGRAQAADIGRALRERKVPVARVESSQWCRCIDTARLAFPGLSVQPVPALNSFFPARDTSADQTQAINARIAAWRGPGVLVLVTHQVNISALTSRTVAAAEGVVLLPTATGARVIGAVQF
jgi:phosphohistidine phosphatase SixA